MSPWDRSRYPDDWEAISLGVKERAGWRCECEGECGKIHGGRCERRHGDTFDPNGAPRKWPVILTTAHYPDPTPANCATDNLLALCQKCHNGLDAPERAKKRAATRRGKEEEVQLSLRVGVQCL